MLVDRRVRKSTADAEAPVSRATAGFSWGQDPIVPTRCARCGSVGATLNSSGSFAAAFGFQLFFAT